MPKRLTCGIVLCDPTSIWALLFEKRWTNEQVMSKGGKTSQPPGWVDIGKSADRCLLHLGCDTGWAKDQLLKMHPLVGISKTSKAQVQSSAKYLAANVTPMRTRRSAATANLQQPSTPCASVNLVTIAAARTSPSECMNSVPAASHSKAPCRSRAPAASPSKNGGPGSGVTKVCLYLLLRLQNPNSH